MKKLLMGTTAIAALGLVAGAGEAAAQDAGKIKLGVGGYYQNFVSYVDQDVDDDSVEFHEVNVRHEGEIHFKGETTLDNGLTIGFDAQLEAITQGDQMDETYMYFTGGWGRLLLGAENSAPYLMAYAAPSAGLGLNSPNFYIFQPLGDATTSGYLNRASDANKVTYFTPRFGGFQLGVSYTPNVDNVSGDRQSFGLNTDDDVGDVGPVIGLGANFVQSFNGFDVAVSGGYEYGDLEANNALGTFDDLEAFSVGLNVGFAGFTIGGSYYDTNNAFDDGADENFWDAGVQYGTGPWAVSFTYAHAEQDVAGGGQDERDQFEIGASYKLSPGVTVVASGQYFDEENDSLDDDDLPVSDTDGWGVAIGTKLSF